MHLIENQRYLEMLRRFCANFPDWKMLNGKSLLVSGATGMIGSFLIDALMLRNESIPDEERCRILAVGRNQKKAATRFPRWMEQEEFRFIQHDVIQSMAQLDVSPDYLIHAASTTHPVAYATEPIDTLLANILGARNLLEIAARKEKSRFLLMSSVEIYGSNRGDVEYFAEDYCGYIDCNTVRAGYPEGKRATEALCQAYIQEKGTDAVILRLPRCYGPTMQMSDTKAIAQFIKKGAAGEDIILKSEGGQLYSYAFVYDAAMALLWVLARGETGQAYNMSDGRSDLMLRELAELVAVLTRTQVRYELPDTIEEQGYSQAQKALMDSNKLHAMGWRAEYAIQNGIAETIAILREIDRTIKCEPGCG